MGAYGRFYNLMLLAIASLLGFLAFQVIRPFVSPIAWAAVLSILFYPLHELISRRVRWRSLAAAFTLLIIILVIVGPFSYVSFMLATEIKEVVVSLEKGETYGLDSLLNVPSVAWVIDKVQSVSGLESIDMEGMIKQNVSNMGRQMAGKVTTGVKNIVAAFINFIFMSITVFFFLRDGGRVLKRLRDYLPFEAVQRDRLETQVKDMVISTIFGGVVVALVQGVMGGTAFYFLDVPSPVIWGTAISVMSFIPMLGTFSVWGSIVVYLVLKGTYMKAFVLLVFGTFGISLVDNIIKPLIIGGRTKMPALLILFSVIGGIKLFGLLGLIMGPMSIALFISVLEIFRNIEGGQDA